MKGTAQVKFKVLDGTEPTFSMPMLVVNGNRVVYRGEDAMLITAKGEPRQSQRQSPRHAEVLR